MSSNVLGICAGLATGVAVTLGAQFLFRPDEPRQRGDSTDRVAAERLTALRSRTKELEEDLERGRTRETELTNRIADLEAKVAATATVASEPAGHAGPAPEITKEHIGREVRAFGAQLQGILTGNADPEAMARLHRLFEHDGEKAVALLSEKFSDDTGDIGLRTVIAHMLAQSGRPDALAVLDKALRDPDTGMIEHRFAAHGLAFSDAEGVKPILERVARDEAEDVGARANAAFGLTRRDLDEGYEIYMSLTDEVISKGDPAGLQYLGGTTLFGEKGYPYMRERLLTYKEPQALLLLIEVLKGKGDKDAIPNIEKLAYDASRPESVQKSAQAALKVLKK